MQERNRLTQFYDILRAYFDNYQDIIMNILAWIIVT